MVVVRKGKEEIKTVRLGRLEDTPVQASVKTDAPAEDKSVVQKALGQNLAGMNDDLRKKFKIKAGEGRRDHGGRREFGAAEKRLNAGDVIVKVTDEEVTNPADVQKRIDQLKKDGKKTALAAGSECRGRRALRRADAASLSCLSPDAGRQRLSATAPRGAVCVCAVDLRRAAGEPSANTNMLREATMFRRLMLAAAYCCCRFSSARLTKRPRARFRSGSAIRRRSTPSSSGKPSSEEMAECRRRDPDV